MSKSRKKALIYAAFLLFSVGMLVIMALFDNQIVGIGDLWNILSQMNLWFLAGAVLAMVFNWVFESLVLHSLLKHLSAPMGFFAAVRNVMLGFFYSSITPMMTGGQPMQILDMNRRKIPAATSTLALTIRFLVFQSVLVLVEIGFFFAAPQFFYDNGHLIWVVVIGFLVNLFIVLPVVLMFISQRHALSFIHRCIRGLHKIRIIRNVESATNKADAFLMRYYSDLTYLLKHFRKMLPCIFFTLGQILVYFSISFFLYKAFGLSGTSIYYIMAVQSFLHISVSFIPTPGSSGGAESFFYLFFRSVFPAELLFTTMLLWRLISYYLGIVLGGFCILGNEIAAARQKRRRIEP